MHLQFAACEAIPVVHTAWPYHIHTHTTF